MVIADRDFVHSFLQRNDRRLHFSIFCTGIVDDHLAGQHDGRVPRRVDLKFIQSIRRDGEISVVRYRERLLEIDALVSELI